MLQPHLWPDTARITTGGHVQIGGCNLPALAASHGTPMYLLDEATLRGTMRGYQAAFAGYPAGCGIHYASKALLNTALAQIVAEEGLGLDVVSGVELLVAQRAGVPMERIHMHGNAKSRSELERALAWGVGAIVIDNRDELAQLVALSAHRDEPQGVLLRVAPNIDAHTHKHIATGSADSKFGLPLDALDAAAQTVVAAPGLRLLGLHAHVGSQLFAPNDVCAAVDVLLDLAAQLRDRHGIQVAEISPGGGLGVPYTADMPATNVATYAATLTNAVQQGAAHRNLPLPRLTVEPGRSVVARAGVAVYEVIASKRFERNTSVGYLHIDGGMADNIRPALYGAHYTALLANRADTPPTERYHVAGRYCESGDVLLRDVALPHATQGDLLAVATAGAYTLSMASNYNLVPRPPLLLVAEEQARVIQQRESEEQVLARDVRL